MTAADHVYFANRAAQEEAAARAAASAVARGRHEEMASMYRLRCLVGSHAFELKPPPALAAA